MLTVNRNVGAYEGGLIIIFGATNFKLPGSAILVKVHSMRLGPKILDVH